MTLEDLGNLGSLLEGVMSLVTLVGVVFAIFEFRRSRKLTAADIYYRTYDNTIDLDRFFFENPSTRPYIYDGKALPVDLESNEDEYSRLMSVAEMVVDLFDSIYNQLPLLPKSMSDGWPEYMAEVGNHSHLIHYFLQKHGSFYDDDLVALLTSQYQEAQNR